MHGWLAHAALADPSWHACSRGLRSFLRRRTRAIEGSHSWSHRTSAKAPHVHPALVSNAQGLRGSRDRAGLMGPHFCEGRIRASQPQIVTAAGCVPAPRCLPTCVVPRSCPSQEKAIGKRPSRRSGPLAWPATGTCAVVLKAASAHIRPSDVRPVWLSSNKPSQEQHTAGTKWSQLQCVGALGTLWRLRARRTLLESSSCLLQLRKWRKSMETTFMWNILRSVGNLADVDDLATSGAASRSSSPKLARSSRRRTRLTAPTSGLLCL